MKTFRFLLLLIVSFVLPCVCNAQRYTVLFTSKDKICQKHNGMKEKANFQKKMAKIAFIDIPIKGKLIIVDTKENVTYNVTTPVKNKLYVIIADKKPSKISTEKFQTLAAKYVNMPASTKMQTAGVGYRGIFDDDFVIDSIYKEPILIE